MRACLRSVCGMSVFSSGQSYGAADMYGRMRRGVLALRVCDNGRSSIFLSATEPTGIRVDRFDSRRDNISKNFAKNSCIFGKVVL